MKCCGGRVVFNHRKSKLSSLRWPLLYHTQLLSESSMKTGAMGGITCSLSADIAALFHRGNESYGREKPFQASSLKRTLMSSVRGIFRSSATQNAAGDPSCPLPTPSRKALLKKLSESCNILLPFGLIKFFKYD
ncbi:hypothetical protein ATANTOWER_009448 [Ataeniobius toweri]|uniref:Uncharacterized protein n=1 Tax=Ataeniobius toweri TaxID=208326 RepID=A0ABU7BB64_9TELE|nr:hypothetical protein [Ataeniobius toweri]